LGVTKKDPAQETFQQLTSFEDVLQRLGQDGSVPEASASTKTRERRKRNRETNMEGDTISGKERGEKDGVHTKHVDSMHVALGVQTGGKKVPGRLAHRQKFIRNKRVDQYSAKHLQEILGTLPKKHTDL